MYIFGDILNSSTLVTNASGIVQNQQEFSPWGTVRSGSINQTKLNYTGQKKDDTGLLYYNARYYDPQLARFVSADVIGVNPEKAQTLNRYSYVGNNPVNRSDATGHCEEDLSQPDGLRHDNADDNKCASAYADVINHENGKALKGVLSLKLSWGFDSLRHLWMWLENGIKFAGADWDVKRVGAVIESLDITKNAFEKNIWAGSFTMGRFMQLLGVKGLRYKNGGGAQYEALTFRMTGGLNDYAQVQHNLWGNEIRLDGFNLFVKDPNFNYVDTIIHEIGHIVDVNMVSSGTSGWVYNGSLPGGGNWGNRVKPKDGKAISDYAERNPHEDFAESFTYLVVYYGTNPQRNTSRADKGRPLDPSRETYLRQGLEAFKYKP